jgi:hypothetical protein
MKPIPACALPTAREVVLACEREAAGRTRVWPRLESDSPRCAFAAADRSRADCAFALTEEGRPPRRVEARFVHRYYEAHEPEASGWETVWEAERPC